MQRVPNWIRFGVCALALICLVSGSAACRTSSHKSVRTHEYDDGPQRDRQMDEELDSEYKMVAPGEMTGPGEMVSE